MKKLISLFLAMFLVGCGAKTGLIGELPIVTNTAESSKVVVVRPSNIVAVAVNWTIAIDGKDVVSIGSGQHIDFAIASGKHNIAVKWFGGWTPTSKEMMIEFSSEPSETVYFEVSPSFSGSEIRQIPVEEGEKLVVKTKNIGS